MANKRSKGADNKTTNDDFIMTGSEHVSQDVNTDERYSMTGADNQAMAFTNQKRTYDLHQSLDTDAILDKRRMQVAEEQMRLRHAEEEHHQKMRHENDLHTIRVQTMAVSSVGNSKIIEEIATATATEIKARLLK